MPEITIIQLSPDELQSRLNAAIEQAVDRVLKKRIKPAKDIQDYTLVRVPEMCEILNIGRTRFECYKKELIDAGMFRLSKKGNYYMKRTDWKKWLESKQHIVR